MFNLFFSCEATSLCLHYHCRCAYFLSNSLYGQMTYSWDIILSKDWDRQLYLLQRTLLFYGHYLATASRLHSLLYTINYSYAALRLLCLELSSNANECVRVLSSMFDSTVITVWNVLNEARKGRFFVISTIACTAPASLFAVCKYLYIIIVYINVGFILIHDGH